MTDLLCSNIYSPCKNCPDRYPACHDSCEKYIDYKAKRSEQYVYTVNKNSDYRKNLKRVGYYNSDYKAKKALKGYKM